MHDVIQEALASKGFQTEISQDIKLAVIYKLKNELNLGGKEVFKYHDQIQNSTAPDAEVKRFMVEELFLEAMIMFIKKTNAFKDEKVAPMASQSSIARLGSAGMEYFEGLPNF